MRRFACVALALAALAAAAEEPAVTIAGSQDDEAFLEEARGAIRHAYPVFRELGGARPENDPEYKLHIYKTRKEYVEADRKLNQGRFVHNGGFFSVDTGECHLLFTPRTEDAYLRRVPLTERMRALLVHETSHVFWRRHVNWYDGAPQWVIEGIAEYCADREIGNDSAKGVYFSTGVHTLRRAAASGRLLPLEDVLVMDYSHVSDAFVRDLYYRESWALVKWLVETKPKAWKALVDGFARVASHDLTPARGRTLFNREVGDPRKMQADWIEWLRSVDCGPWESRFGDWRLDGEELEGTAYPETGSAIFHEQEFQGDFTASAEVWIQDVAKGQADLLVGCWDDRARNFVKASFLRNGLTAILVLKEDQWKRVAFAECEEGRKPAVPVETWTRVSVSVRGRRVTASVGGVELVSAEIGDEDVRLDGRWGLGNYDSSVRFRDWRAEPAGR